MIKDRKYSNKKGRNRFRVEKMSKTIEYTTVKKDKERYARRTYHLDYHFFCTCRKYCHRSSDLDVILRRKYG